MYELIKTLSLLVYPFGVFFVLAGLALGLRILGVARWPLRVVVVAVAWLWLWSMPATSERLRYALESRYPNVPADQAPTADAILVLGGAFRGDVAWPYPHAGRNIDRYWHGARLFHAGRAPLIVLSGGRHPARPDNPSEAESGARFLMDMGVPAEALLLDDQSMTTFEHIVYITPMLEERGVDRVLLVTSAIHMRRSEAVFRGTALEVMPVATDFSVPSDPVISPRRYFPSVAGLSESTRVVHEIVGYWFYRLRGQI